MLYPAPVNRKNSFEDLMKLTLPSFSDFFAPINKLYPRSAAEMMKVDVHEFDDHYEIDVDLPGFEKEEISLSLDDGQLNISAEKVTETENAQEGKVICRERHVGSMKRTIFIGDEITQEDVKAKLENGVLSIDVLKKNEDKLTDKHLIEIS